MITLQILSKIHDETQKHLTKKIKHNLKLQKKLTFQVGRTLKLPAKFENFQRFPNKLIPLIL
jgi:hypothetical protein